MGVLLWIACGVAAGFVARLVMDGPRAGGIPMGILLGVLAACLGGTLASLATGGFSTAIEIRSLLAAASAAIGAMLAYRAYALRCDETPALAPAPVRKGATK